MSEFTLFLKGEWAVLSSAPLTFVVGWLLIAGLSYVFIRKLLLDQKDATIETLRERVSWTEEQRDSYKDRFKEFEGSTEAIKNSSPIELKKKALELVTDIRTFLERDRRESNRIHTRDWLDMVNASDEEQDSKWNEFTDKLMRQSTETILEYDRTFKIPAVVMRDQLLEHLGDYSVEESRSVHYEHPTNTIGMGMVADDLEKMARHL